MFSNNSLSLQSTFFTFIKAQTMKLFKTILSLFYSIIMGLLPATIFVLLGLLVFNENQNGLGVFFLLLFSIIGIVLAYFIAKMVFNKGAYTFMLSQKASPDFDKLAPTSNDRVRSLSPNDYVESVVQRNNFINKAKVCIWGQMLDDKADICYTIKTVEFDSNNNCLSIIFHNKLSVHIWEPALIIETHDFLKILNACRIRRQWLNNNTGELNYCEYKKNKRKITVQSNVTVSTDALSLAMPAFLFAKL